MDYPEIQGEFVGFGFDSINNVKPYKFIVDMMKFNLVNGLDKALMSRKSPGKSIQFDSAGTGTGSRTRSSEEETTRKARTAKLRVHSTPNQQLVNEFPLNMVAVLVIKSIHLFVTLFTIPIWFSYLSIMMFLFPLQTLAWARRYSRKIIVGIMLGFYSRLTTFISARIKLGIRCGWAAFWAIYVYMFLLGLLVSGFLIGGLTMKRLVEKPIQTTETLHFDYTMASPAAFVPILGVDGARPIPYNHKLQLAVSLTLPESDYNRNLGVFQVKVEFVSASDKISGSSSYPCMLKFKSQPIRAVETVFKSVPLIAGGFQSDVQMLNVKINDFTQGQDPTLSLRVILEQRAEYDQSGAGIPEIYSASVSLQSELPHLNKIIWSWRTSIFVWISLMSFIIQLLLLLIFCRPIILPRGRIIVRRAKKNQNICW